MPYAYLKGSTLSAEVTKASKAGLHHLTWEVWRPPPPRELFWGLKQVAGKLAICLNKSLQTQGLKSDVMQVVETTLAAGACVKSEYGLLKPIFLWWRVGMKTSFWSRDVGQKQSQRSVSLCVCKQVSVFTRPTPAHQFMVSFFILSASNLL